MQGWDLLDHLQQEFIGLDTCYPLADGRRVRRHYLDSAATTLLLRPAFSVACEFLRHYANTHSALHYGARVATATYHWAHQQVLRFVNADPDRYTCVFTGSGATAGFNRLARRLAACRPERDLVLVSQMEHHSNDLPHRRHAGQVLHVPLCGEPPALGQVSLAALAQLLERHGERVNYVAVTGASNVTGLLNPLAEIAALAHAWGAWVVVDGAQLVAHAPVQVCNPARPEGELDFLVFSGHKVYAPGAPGVVVGRRDLLAGQEPDELGGGMVDRVFLQGYQVSPVLPEREEAGTPNIVGAVLLGSVLEVLGRIGMERIRQREAALLHRALDILDALPGVRLYGRVDGLAHTATLAFNLEGLNHGLVAAVLNDYHNVAVRNECFCAHPYVRELLKPELWALDLDPDSLDAADLIRLHQGMVRASFGLYTTEADLEALGAGLKDLLARPGHYRSLYRAAADGNYHHRTFAMPARALFDPLAALGRAVGGYALG